MNSHDEKLQRTKNEMERGQDSDEKGGRRGGATGVREKLKRSGTTSTTKNNRECKTTIKSGSNRAEKKS